MIPQQNIDYFWNTLVLPRVGSATHRPDAYVWGGSFSTSDINQGTDCSGAFSAELSALVRGPGCIYQRQLWTGTFAGANPGDQGPFGGVADTAGLICIADPNDAPADAAMIVAVRQETDPSDAHVICRVQGIDIEMGGAPDNYHTSQTTSQCASVEDRVEFNQWFYLPGPIEGGSAPVTTPPQTLFGVDLSNNNWRNASEISAWLDECFHREGFSWMEHKVSEGSYFADRYWTTVRDWCQADGVPVIGYHYVTTDDPASQAAKFLGNGGGQIAMLDVEANSGGIGNFWAVVNAFNAAGVNVATSYLPHWYWQQIGSPDLSQVPGLISSNYPATGTYAWNEYYDAGGDNGPGWTPYGGATPVIWQFTDAALVDGKSVDANAFRGTLDQLRALLGGQPVTPPGGISMADAQSIQAALDGVDPNTLKALSWRINTLLATHKGAGVPDLPEPFQVPWPTPSIFDQSTVMSAIWTQILADGRTGFDLLVDIDAKLDQQLALLKQQQAAMLKLVVAQSPGPTTK